MVAGPIWDRQVNKDKSITQVKNIQSRNPDKFTRLGIWKVTFQNKLRTPHHRTSLHQC